MRIYIKYGSIKPFFIEDVDVNTKIKDIKARIAELRHTAIDRLILVCAKELDDEQTVGYYNLQNDSGVHLLIKTCADDQ